MKSKNKLTIFILTITTCSIINIQSLPLSTISTDDIHYIGYDNLQQHQEARQLFFDAKTKETNPPNFMRLVLMRLVYGLASTMGFEERLEETFNGAFVPPNADGNDLLGLFGVDGSANDDGGGAADYADIFDDY